jgi:hypothetical protein
VLETLKGVLNIDKPHKDGTVKSESEITMCDRMQMYSIFLTMFTYLFPSVSPLAATSQAISCISNDR